MIYFEIVLHVLTNWSTSVVPIICNFQCESFHYGKTSNFISFSKIISIVYMGIKIRSYLPKKYGAESRENSNPETWPNSQHSTINAIIAFLPVMLPSNWLVGWRRRKMSLWQTFRLGIIYAHFTKILDSFPTNRSIFSLSARHNPGFFCSRIPVLVFICCSF